MMGGTRMTIDSFVSRAKILHKDRYDYTKSVYNGRLNPIEIICRDHGSFWPTPAMHIHSTKATGCPSCGILKMRERRKGHWYTVDEIAELNSIHNNKYTYDTEIVFIKNVRHIRVICPIHGEFTVGYTNHRSGTNCRLCWCSSITINSPEQVSQHMKHKFGITTTYEYVSTTHVGLICNIHGVQSISRSDHLNKNTQCPKCQTTQRNLHHQIHQQDIIERLRKVHNDVYQYDITRPTYLRDRITIICPIHGSFEQQIKKHLLGQKCPKCQDKYITTSDWITKAQIAHGDIYQYDLVDYKKSNDPIVIICPIHGSFEQTPNNHLNGTGCPRCKSTWGETVIEQYLEHLAVNYRKNDRKVLRDSENNFRELDFWLPDHNIAIEFHGLYWHTETWGKKSRTYHSDKLNRCEDVGIRLIQIMEDELLNHQDVVLNKIAMLLNRATPGCSARKTKILRIDWSITKPFLEKYHLQGAGSSGGINYGAYHDDQLIAVMGFGYGRRCMGRTPISGEFELIRFCSDMYTHAGLFSKMLRAFELEYNPKTVFSYSDRRWSIGHVYQSNGFLFEHHNTPNYWYVDKRNIKRTHRYSFRKSELKKRFGSTSGLTEYQLALANGYDRVWDAGSSLWVKHYTID